MTEQRPWPEAGSDEEWQLRQIAYAYSRELAARCDAQAALAEREAPVHQHPAYAAAFAQAVRQQRRREARRRVLRRCRRAVVAAGLTVGILLGSAATAFALSPELRAFIEGFFITRGDGYAEIGLELDGGFRKAIPQAIPDGFTLTERWDDAAFGLRYENGEQYIQFQTSDGSGTLRTDTEYATYDYSHEIDGREAVAITFRNGNVMLLWYDETTMYRLNTSLPLETALEIAESAM